MNVHEIVTKLIGPIDAVGESQTDEKRLNNLKQMTALVDLLLGDIGSVRGYKDRQEMSMKLIGKHADAFLKDVSETTWP